MPLESNNVAVLVDVGEVVLYCLIYIGSSPSSDVDNSKNPAFDAVAPAAICA